MPGQRRTGAEGRGYDAPVAVLGDDAWPDYLIGAVTAVAGGGQSPRGEPPAREAWRRCSELARMRGREPRRARRRGSDQRGTQRGADGHN